jgi:hypothetical protein
VTARWNLVIFLKLEISEIKQVRCAKTITIQRVSMITIRSAGPIIVRIFGYDDDRHDIHIDAPKGSCIEINPTRTDVTYDAEDLDDPDSSESNMIARGPEPSTSSQDQIAMQFAMLSVDK